MIAKPSPLFVSQHPFNSAAIFFDPGSPHPGSPHPGSLGYFAPATASLPFLFSPVEKPTPDLVEADLVGTQRYAIPELGTASLPWQNRELVLSGPLRAAIQGRSLNEPERNQILGNAWACLSSSIQLAAQSSFRFARHVGIEIECSLVTADGRYARGAAAPILGQLDSPSWHPEAGSGSLELVSKPKTLGPGALSALARELAVELQAASRLAEEQRLFLLGTGITPELAAGESSEPAMNASSPGTASLHEAWELRERNPAMPGRKYVDLQFADGGSYPLTTSESAWNVINALHITFQAKGLDDALCVFNILRNLTPLAMALSANTGTLNGQPLKYQDYRPLIIAGSGPLDFNFDTCCGLVTDSAESLYAAFGLVVPKDPVALCPMVALTSGAQPSLRDCFESVRESVFPSIQLRLHPRIPGAFLIEYRPMSVQLSLAENIALTTFLTLAVEYFSREQRVQDIGDRQAVLAQTLHALKDGLDAPLVCPGGPQAGNQMSARLCGLHIVEELKRWALAEGILAPEEHNLLAPLLTNILTRGTGAQQFAQAVRNSGISAAVHQYPLFSASDARWLSTLPRL